MAEEQIESTVSASGVMARLKGSGLIGGIALIAATLAFAIWLYVEHESPVLAFVIGALVSILASLCISLARRP